LVGFGWRQCIAYDALIHAFLASITYLVTKRLSNDQPRWLAPATGTCVLLAGTFGRPDELAMSFGMLGLLALLDPCLALGPVIVSGVFFGLCAGTSIGAAIVFALIGFTLLGARTIPPSRLIGRTGTWGFTALTVSAACLAPMIVPHPQGLRDFLHLSGEAAKPAYLEAIRFTWQYGKGYLLLSVGLFMVGLIALANVRHKEALRKWAGWWVGPLAGTIFVLLYVPAKPTYLWFAGPWLLAVSGVSIWTLVKTQSWWMAIVPSLFLAGAVIAGSVRFVVSTAIMIALSIDQSVGTCGAVLDELIPKGSTVITDQSWWFLADDRVVFDSWFSDLQDLSRIDYVVLSGNGTGQPGMPGRVKPRYQKYVDENFELIHDGLNRQPLTVCGYRLTNSAYGFGCVILARRSDLAGQRSDRHGPSFLETSP
jgi:hypothetical protein